MGISEFVDWQLFVAEHPLPSDLADIHNAMQMAMLANINRGQDQPPIEVREFFVLGRRPAAKVERRTQTPPPLAPVATPKPGLSIAQQMRALSEGGTTE